MFPRSRWIHLTILLAFSPFIISADPVPPQPTGYVFPIGPFRQGYPLDDHLFTRMRGSATLTADKTTVRLGEPIWAEAIYHASPDSEAGAVLNPFNEPLLPETYKFVLYDSNNRLMRYWGGPYADGSHTLVEKCDWVRLVHGNCVGTAQQLTPFGGKDGSQEPASLAPGKYYLQVVYARAFVGLYMDKGGLMSVQGTCEVDFLKHYDDTELFRSNTLEIDLIK